MIHWWPCIIYLQSVLGQSSCVCVKWRKRLFQFQKKHCTCPMVSGLTMNVLTAIKQSKESLICNAVDWSLWALI